MRWPALARGGACKVCSARTGNRLMGFHCHIWHEKRFGMVSPAHFIKGKKGGGPRARVSGADRRRWVGRSCPKRQPPCATCWKAACGLERRPHAGSMTFPAYKAVSVFRRARALRFLQPTEQKRASARRKSGTGSVHQGQHHPPGAWVIRQSALRKTNNLRASQRKGPSEGPLSDLFA